MCHSKVDLFFIFEKNPWKCVFLCWIMTFLVLSWILPGTFCRVCLHNFYYHFFFNKKFTCEKLLISTEMDMGFFLYVQFTIPLFLYYYFNILRYFSTYTALLIWGISAVSVLTYFWPGYTMNNLRYFIRQAVNVSVRSFLFSNFYFLFQLFPTFLIHIYSLQ